MSGDGRCTKCGASIHLSNCNPATDPCEQCGQCSCLASPWVLAEKGGES